jgi:hypothetical protein
MTYRFMMILPGRSDYPAAASAVQARAAASDGPAEEIQTLDLHVPGTGV